MKLTKQYWSIKTKDGQRQTKDHYYGGAIFSLFFWRRYSEKLAGNGPFKTVALLLKSTSPAFLVYTERIHITM